LVPATLAGLFCFAGLGLAPESPARADFFADCETAFSFDFSSVAFVLRSDAGDFLLSLASGTGVRRSLSERPSVLKEKGLMGVTLLLTSRLEPAPVFGDAGLLPSGALLPGFPILAVLGGMIGFETAGSQASPRPQRNANDIFL
jgi:hypothetical protein